VLLDLGLTGGDTSGVLLSEEEGEEARRCGGLEVVGLAEEIFI